MYKKGVPVVHARRVAVLLNKPIAFLTYSLPVAVVVTEIPCNIGQS